MERGEPSLVPQWLRSTSGGGTGTGTSSNHFAVSQADASVLALPKRNGLSKCMGNTYPLHSPLLDRSSSSNSRRTSSSNGSTKHDRNSFSPRSYRSHRDKDRQRSTITDNWDLEYSDPLRSMISRKTDGPLRRSLSMISRRPGEVQPRRTSTDNGNGTHTVGTGITAIHKVSFGTDDRPKTPDTVRVSSPGLRSIHVMSIGNSSLIGNDGWTSALAEVPTSPACCGSSNATLGGGSKLGGLNMAEALVRTPARSQNIPQSSAQSQRDELAIAQSKKLIPMTPSLPKPLVNQSDKLKPKTPGRSSEVTAVPKNGTSAKVESPKSPAKLLLLKPGRENGGSTVIKDIPSQTTISSNRVPNNNQSKRNFQSRSDFFKMMRKKSMNTTSVCTDSGTGADMVDKTEKIKEVSGAKTTTGGNGSEVMCNGETCTAALESFEDENVAICSNEEERAFLRSLGWEENAGDDEALTEEEINAFYQEVWRLRATSKLCRDRWPKIFSHFDIGSACPGGAPSEPSASSSRN